MNMRVLIVEDNADCARPLQGIIQSYRPKPECRWAANGTDGIRDMLEWNPHLVFLDISMPDMDGIDVLRNVRPAGFTGKILMYSGLSESEYKQLAINSGADGYIVKSTVTLPLLMEAIREAETSLTKHAAL